MRWFTTTSETSYGWKPPTYPHSALPRSSTTVALDPTPLTAKWDRLPTDYASLDPLADAMEPSMNPSFDLLSHPSFHLSRRHHHLHLTSSMDMRSTKWRPSRTLADVDDNSSPSSTGRDTTSWKTHGNQPITSRMRQRPLPTFTVAIPGSLDLCNCVDAIL